MTGPGTAHAAEYRLFASTAEVEMHRLRNWFYETQTPSYPETPAEVVDAVIARMAEYRAYAEKMHNAAYGIR